MGTGLIGSPAEVAKFEKLLAGSTRITCDQAEAMHEYLWRTYGPAHGMVSSYTGNPALLGLLKTLTKGKAELAYILQIRYWFKEGPDKRSWCYQYNRDGEDFELNRLIRNDPIANMIYNRVIRGK